MTGEIEQESIVWIQSVAVYEGAERLIDAIAVGVHHDLDVEPLLFQGLFNSRDVVLNPTEAGPAACVLTCRAMAQAKPSISRAMAAVTTLAGFPAALSLR